MGKKLVPTPRMLIGVLGGETVRGFGVGDKREVNLIAQHIILVRFVGSLCAYLWRNRTRGERSCTHRVDR